MRENDTEKIAAETSKKLAGKGKRQGLPVATGKLQAMQGELCRIFVSSRARPSRH
jgi:hypothetical protein